ncbi:Cas10/Cmr2 second palm domain-containing protein [Phascolarctobacterium succinatutens]
MTEKVGAILLDTRSIQKYVFGCNRLKTNTGASYLVDGIFTEAMVDVLKKSGLKMPAEDWKEAKKMMLSEDNAVECEIAYIGGGNMLVLVRKGEESLRICRELVKEWSLKVLLEAPGLKTGAAIGEIDLAYANFQASLNALYKQLKENQNNVLPQVDLPYTGFSVECDYSGKAANVYNKEYKRLVSAEVEAKTAAYDAADKKIKKNFSEVIGDEYDFCSELESLGYKDGESYISVIHIDGNNMGVKFSNCRDMQERKNLSKKVQETVEHAFGYLIKKIVTEYDTYADVLDMRALKQGNKRLLPLRPIIIGGDDITFICPGRMGLQYAQAFIEYVNSEDLLDKDLYNYIKKETGKQINRSLSCCAGVAIVPAKYPFFRAYELAEQLCDEAKDLSRKDDGNYLDFAILHGEKYGDIKLLRKEQYESANGSLHYGPYNVLGKENDKQSVKGMLALSAKLAADKMPRNKVKELRRVLHEDKHSMSIFLENCPEICELVKKENKLATVVADDLWDEIEDKDKVIFATRYIDAIEAIDFNYPEKKTGAK